MTKAGKYWILAISMIVLGLAEAVSGFVLWLGFPTGGGGSGRAWGGGGGRIGDLTFLELSKHTWIDIHDWVAVALVVLVFIHVVLHWKWIVRMAKSIFRGTPERLVADLVRVD
ncbi:DUF4405 domain-containing protein [Chloroflexota bacterium]